MAQLILSIVWQSSQYSISHISGFAGIERVISNEIYNNVSKSLFKKIASPSQRGYFLCPLPQAQANLMLKSLRLRRSASTRFGHYRTKGPKQHCAGQFVIAGQNAISA